MSPAEIDPESGCRIPLIRREELDADGQKAFDFYTSGTMRGLHGPAGIWLHSPKLAELYRPLGTYLRSGAGLSLNPWIDDFERSSAGFGELCWGHGRFGPCVICWPVPAFPLGFLGSGLGWRGGQGRVGRVRRRGVARLGSR